MFIGYEYDSDKSSKDRLLRWDVNKEFDFASYGRTVDVAVNSEAAAVFKPDLAARIGDSSHFLFIVGTETYRSAWIACEIRKAVKLKKRLVTAKIDSTNDSSTAMQVGASWSMMFNFDSIKKAVN